MADHPMIHVQRHTCTVWLNYDNRNSTVGKCVWIVSKLWLNHEKRNNRNVAFRRTDTLPLTFDQAQKQKWSVQVIFSYIHMQWEGMECTICVFVCVKLRSDTVATFWPKSWFLEKKKLSCERHWVKYTKNDKFHNWQHPLPWKQSKMADKPFFFFFYLYKKKLCNKLNLFVTACI